MVETPADSAFFKSIVLVPFIGIAAQLWKDFILRNELKAIKLDEVNIDSSEGLKRYNDSAKKIIEIINLSACSVSRGKFVDIAGFIAGLMISRFSPIIGCLIVFGSLAALIARQFIHLSAWDLDIELIKKRPKDGLMKGYACTMMNS